MKFLVDESSGRRLFHFLREKGYDATFVKDVLPKADDIDVLKFAEKEQRIIISNDKDFGELIFRLGMPSSGVILLRLRIDNYQNRKKSM